jgi:hypothetical protein
MAAGQFLAVANSRNISETTAFVWQTGILPGRLPTIEHGREAD